MTREPEDLVLDQIQKASLNRDIVRQALFDTYVEAVSEMSLREIAREGFSGFDNLDDDEILEELVSARYDETLSVEENVAEFLKWFGAES